MTQYLCDDVKHFSDLYHPSILFVDRNETRMIGVVAQKLLDKIVVVRGYNHTLMTGRILKDLWIKCALTDSGVGVHHVDLISKGFA